MQAKMVEKDGFYERVYRCQPLDEDMLMGDRYGVAEAEQPMELNRLVFRMMYPDQPVPDDLPRKTIRVAGVKLDSALVPKVKVPTAAVAL